MSKKYLESLGFEELGCKTKFELFLNYEKNVKKARKWHLIKYIATLSGHRRQPTHKIE